MGYDYFIVSNDWFDHALGERDLTKPLRKHGMANGYVSIPSEHPLAGKHYDEVDTVLCKECNFAVHGGLTYGEHLSKCAPDIQFAYTALHPGRRLDDDVWIYGFDTMHYGDTQHKWSYERCLEEARNLKDAFVRASITIHIFDECGEQ